MMALCTPYRSQLDAEAPWPTAFQTIEIPTEQVQQRWHLIKTPALSQNPLHLGVADWRTSAVDG